MSRRQSTMRPPEPPGSVRSAIPIPMPTPAAPPPMNKRMSLAGPALRNQMLPPMIPGSVQQPGSLYKSHNVNPMLLASTSKAGVGRTPAGNRRGSMWGGGTTPAPAPLAARDTRPLRDRAYQQDMRRETAAWLQETGCPCTAQTLANVTAKDFKTIFQHLILLLDPNFPFDAGARLEDDFIDALKAQVYPYVGQLDIKWLVTPASMHAWPALLGVLHWLVEMGKVKLNYMESHHPTLQDSKDVPEEFSDRNHRRAVATDFVSESYEDFLAGSDNFDTQKQALEDRYERNDRSVKDEIVEIKADYKAKKAQLKEIKNSRSPLEVLKTENAKLKEDQAKCQEAMKRWEERKRGIVDSIAKLKAGNEATRIELQKLRKQEEDTDKILDEQNMSLEEIDQMNHDYAKLERNLVDLKTKIAEARKALSTLEITVAQRSETAEDAIDKFNREIVSLGFLPSLPPPHEGMDISLRLNPGAADPQDLLHGLSIRGKIRPALAEIAAAYKAKSSAIEQQRLKVDHEIDQVATACQELDIRILSLSRDVSSREKQTNEFRERLQRAMIARDEEISQLQSKVSRAAEQASMDKVEASRHLQAVEIAYHEQVAKIERTKARLMRDMLQNAQEIVAFKEEIVGHFEDLLEIAEST